MDYKNIIATKLSEITGLSCEDITGMLEVPQQSKMGDFALPCFKLSRTLRKAPNMIADDLKEKFPIDGSIKKVESVSGYLNFFIDKDSFIEATLKEIIEKGDKYGSSDMGGGKTICIDYSSVNVAKPLHIGHLSTTVIGHSLYKIYNFLGYKCVGINHLGDYGTQFGKLIVAYEKWGERDKVQESGVEELTRLYVKYHDEAEKDPSLDDEARMWFKKIEDKDPAAIELFNWFQEITLKEVKEIYSMLGIEFDYYTGESFFTDKMQPIVDKLEETKLLVEDQGAKVVRLDDYDMPPCIIQRKDGASLYATRDMAAALYRKQTFDFAKCLYVVAYQQDLHFKQFFKVLDLAGYDWSTDLYHINFGMVSLEDGAMSTRKGRVVLLKDILSRAVEKSASIIEEKNPELEDKENIARIVGVGATVFSALKNNRIKDIVFSWDKALNFDGETAPYVQYTHARCNSVLAKSTISLDGEIDFSTLQNDDAIALVTSLNEFKDIIQSAARRYEPSMITRHVVDVAQKYNKYYFDHRILDDDSEEKNRARLMLTKASMQVIKTGLALIGIEAPNRM
jgi:arginyl-tRNA synthetase